MSAQLWMTHLFLPAIIQGPGNILQKGGSTEGMEQQAGGKESYEILTRYICCTQKPTDTTVTCTTPEQASQNFCIDRGGTLEIQLLMEELLIINGR